ncbi:MULTISPECIES: DJ-1 family glyoxalase III [unclassified Vibrio]|uniref:DJ-1 family glyoxalase III n=1 Tax=Vibrio sp. HB236076 TaxID=3232307 RepID=A0AB39HHS4_9VIBR|nr:DJ-1 family glyoxalase III [Vibrio sp. HB161653]MDP5254898.1 DJ-1/PfpI family protein [Vibrio sp. HB161653]
MNQTVLVPIANGSEEIEAVTVIDTLIRANYQVVVASANFDSSCQITGSRGIALQADCPLVNVADEEFDAIVLPGGVGGAECFRDSTLLIEMLKQHRYDGKWLAAICAAPAVVLQSHQLYPKAIMTAHPDFEAAIPRSQWRSKRVTVDINHKLITSQGPGSALEFSVEIIAKLSGKAHAKQVVQPMVPLPQLNYDKLGGQPET